MNIAIDTYHAQRPYGGIARYLRGLVNALARLNAEDRYILFANRFRESEQMWQPDMANVTTCEARIPRRLLQASWDHAHWPPVEKWTGEIDVFHGTHFILPVVRGAKTLLTVHDLTWLRHPEFFHDHGLNKRGYLHEFPAALERADAVIAVSQSTKNDLVELMNYPEDRIRVIFEGVEPHFFIHNDEAENKCILEKYGLKQPYFIFLVGTPEPRKNLKRTIQAAHRASSEIHVAVVGPKIEIKKLLGSMVERVYFLGAVPDEDLPVLLHHAEISLYPSLYEGFGLPILESMAAGVPVITSDVSSCPEVAGDVGMLVDPYSVDGIAEAIASLMADEPGRCALRKAGVDRASGFSWKQAASSVLKLYREVC